MTQFKPDSVRRFVVQKLWSRRGENMKSPLPRFTRAMTMALLSVLGMGAAAPPMLGQLNGNCIVSVLNRNVQVNPDGSWQLPNIPAGFGSVRARATCVRNGLTTSGQSDLFNITANRMNAILPITLGSTTPILTNVAINAPAT